MEPDTAFGLDSDNFVDLEPDDFEFSARIKSMESTDVSVSTQFSKISICTKRYDGNSGEINTEFDAENIVSKGNENESGLRSGQSLSNYYNSPYQNGKGDSFSTKESIEDDSNNQNMNYHQTYIQQQHMNESTHPHSYHHTSSSPSNIPQNQQHSRSLLEQQQPQFGAKLHRESHQTKRQHTTSKNGQDLEEGKNVGLRGREEEEEVEVEVDGNDQYSSKINSSLPLPYYDSKHYPGHLSPHDQSPSSSHFYSPSNSLFSSLPYSPSNSHSPSSPHSPRQSQAQSQSLYFERRGEERGREGDEGRYSTERKNNFERNIDEKLEFNTKKSHYTAPMIPSVGAVVSTSLTQIIVLSKEKQQQQRQQQQQQQLQQKQQQQQQKQQHQQRPTISICTSTSTSSSSLPGTSSSSPLAPTMTLNKNKLESQKLNLNRNLFKGDYDIVLEESNNDNISGKNDNSDDNDSYNNDNNLSRNYSNNVNNNDCKYYNNSKNDNKDKNNGNVNNIVSSNEQSKNVKLERRQEKVAEKINERINEKKILNYNKPQWDDNKKIVYDDDNIASYRVNGSLATGTGTGTVKENIGQAITSKINAQIRAKKSLTLSQSNPISHLSGREIQKEMYGIGKVPSKGRNQGDKKKGNFYNFYPDSPEQDGGLSDWRGKEREREREGDTGRGRVKDRDVRFSNALGGNRDFRGQGEDQSRSQGQGGEFYHSGRLGSSHATGGPLRNNRIPTGYEAVPTFVPPPLPLELLARKRREMH